MCRECQGQGERIDPKLRCKTCTGKKVTRKRKILEVSIDKGMDDGQRITFAGEGDQGWVFKTFLVCFTPHFSPNDGIMWIVEQFISRYPFI